MQLYQETPDYKDIQVLTKDYGFIDYVLLLRFSAHEEK